MKIAILTTDTSHHRYFINRLFNHFKNIFVVFEERTLRKSYKTGPFFDKEQNAFNNKFFEYTSRELDNEVLKNTIRCLSSNGPKSIEFLNRVCPDICISFGTGILREKVLKIPDSGTINIHRGIIQSYRGLDSDLWAILNEDFSSIGTTIHFVDSDLDTGPVISQEKYNLCKKDKIFHIQYHTTVLSTSLVINSLESLRSAGEIPSFTQKTLGKYYTAMSLEDKIIALKKFNMYVDSLC